MSSAAIEQKHAQALCGSEKGRAYAGDDHEAEHPALRHDIHGMYRHSLAGNLRAGWHCGLSRART